MLEPLFPSRLWLWGGRLALLALLLVGLAGGAVVGGLLALVDEAPPMVELEDYSPDQISRLLDRTGRVVSEFSVQRRDIVRLDEIPLILICAFLAIEDERFFDHVGVSPWDVLVAARANLRRGTIVRGASTLTMQLARKTLADITDERRMERKIREALAALRIERRYSKDQILEFYLNQIPMGNGLWGVQAAARAYFGVDVPDLSVAQAATIAGIAALPERYNPRDAPERSTERRNVVLQSMRDGGYISEAEYLEARATPMTLGSMPHGVRRAPHFVDQIRRQILADPDLGAEALFHAGTVIESTVDLELQELAEEMLVAGLVSAERLWQGRKRLRSWEEEEDLGWRLRADQRRLVEIEEVTPTGLILRFDDYLGDADLPARLPYLHPEEIIAAGNLIDTVITEVDHRQMTFRARLTDQGHVQGALVVLDVHTGEILALVGGADWYDEFNAGQWNRAILGGRQPGSCFKPFVFAAALEEGGLTPASMFLDERIEFTSPGAEPYVPRNFEDRYFGPTTLLEAVEHSRNIVTVRMTAEVGAQRIRDFATRFDFTADEPRWRIPPYVNIGLGLHDVTPLELACAIASFANEGIIVRPRAWLQILDAEGHVLRRNPFVPRRVVSRQTARQVLRMMEQVIASGSGYENVGRHLLDQPGIPALAGKTGTTNGTADAWFAGLTPEWAGVVFVGFDDNATMGPRMTGSRVAGPIWREFMERAVALRPPTETRFPEPPNLTHVDLCPKTGMLLTEACAWGHTWEFLEARRYENVPFVPGTEPTTPCPVSSPLL